MFYLNRVTNVPSNNYQWTNGDYRNFVNVITASACQFDDASDLLVIRKKH